MKATPQGSNCARMSQKRAAFRSFGADIRAISQHFTRNFEIASGFDLRLQSESDFFFAAENFSVEDCQFAV